MPVTDNVGTFNLTSETVTIQENMGVRSVSILLVSGTVTVSGTMRLGARASDPIVLEDGIPLNISFDFSIDGYIIDATAGAATVITGK